MIFQFNRIFYSICKLLDPIVFSFDTRDKVVAYNKFKISSSLKENKVIYIIRS